MIDRLLPVLLLGGCVLFAAIVFVETRPASTPELSASAALPLPEEGSRRAPRQGLAGPGRYAEMVATILARPLFSSTRRPPASGGAAPTDTGLSDMRLTGIVTSPGRRIAIFAPAGAKLLTVSEGDNLSGWRVESITADEVSLSGPEGTKTLQPKFDPNLVPPPPPPTPGNSRPGPSAVVAPPPLRPGFPPGFVGRAPPRPGQRGPR